MKLKRIAIFFLLFIVLFYLTGCENKDENEELIEKTDSSIKYLDTSLISLLNKLNNLSFENYYVSTEKVKLDSSSSNKDSGSSESSENSESGQSGEQEAGNKNGDKSSSSKKDESESLITINEIKSKNVLVSDKNDIKWDEIKKEAESLYEVWNSILIDLYKLGISNDEILKFSDYMDNTITNIKQENKGNSLISIANLYNILPNFLNSYSKDRNRTNLQATKAHIVNAYSAVGNKDWNTVKSEVSFAEQSYSSVLSDTDFVNKNSYNTNKTYVSLKELQNSIDTQDEEIFYIKYKNFMEEMNIIS